MSGSRTQSVVWAGVIGVLTFAAVEMLVVGGLLHPPRLYYAWGGAAILPILVYFFLQGLATGGGALAGSIHRPVAGVATPAREYSQAQSLAARGQHRRAIQAYEAGLKKHPEDFDPYMRIARIYRDNLNSFELAIRWYERARENGNLSDAQEFRVSNEMIDMYRHRLNDPKKAILELEKLLLRFPDHPSAAVVEKELSQLRG